MCVVRHPYMWVAAIPVLGRGKCVGVKWSGVSGVSGARRRAAGGKSAASGGGGCAPDGCHRSTGALRWAEAPLLCWAVLCGRVCVPPTPGKKRTPRHHGGGEAERGIPCHKRPAPRHRGSTAHPHGDPGGPGTLRPGPPWRVTRTRCHCTRHPCIARG